MIEFLTLFLGLVSGPQEIRLTVAEPVAAVELLLDGEELARLAGEPWTTEVDLGPEIVVRELVAVAYDGDGEELGRATQILNLPRPDAEARVVLERDASGKTVVAARLSWESLAGRMPLRVRAWLDGVPLPAIDPARVPLPAHDGERFHVFEAELDFAGGVVARAQAGFGGGNVEELSRRLTAVPVRLPRDRTPSLARVQGWFGRGADEPRVVGVDKGQATITVVRGRGVLEAMERLEGRIAEQLGSPVIAPSARPGSLATVGDLATGATAGAARRLQTSLTLGTDHVLHLLLPFAKKVEHRYLALELFAASPPITPDQGGIYWSLTRRIELPGLADEQRIADAVAIAGLRAAADNRRRALVLVLGEDTRDASRHTPAQIRRFLASVAVPLVVWFVGEGAPPADWPEAEPLADFQDLRRAARALEKDLEHQRVIWLDGAWAPSRIRLAPDAGARRLGG